ncbi:GNAT family N-acetyltransferase [Tessaracoccus sp. HDW20]|nr:GNAT family N-acetyltransferase [Tessaracoccus coleopterorum]
MARQGTVTTLAEAEAYVAALQERGDLAFAITDDDRLVGLVGVSVDAVNRVGWFWYWMNASHRGRRWASLAATAVANWALSSGGCERLELGHRADNPLSGNVAGAAGFVHEGRERGKFLIDGQRVDVLTYGRLVSDPWPIATLEITR